jgi:FtsZ-binding cell division protein ZapB
MSNKNKENEIEELKEKIEIITQKLTASKRDRDKYHKENRELQNEIYLLQSNMRQMIPGFSNTSNSFPMLNELQNRLSEFFKCDCQDIFFDLLSPELNMDGIVFFYKNCFVKVMEMIKNYFDPLENLMKKTICIDFLWTPIDNVLRKSAQSNWKMIFSQMSLEQNYYSIMQYVQNNLKLQDENPQANKIIVDFLKKVSEIFFCCYICDPMIFIDMSSIGLRTGFNALRYDSLDGFIKQKHDCISILPACYKTNVTNNENCVIKSHVLPYDYEFP